MVSCSQTVPQILWRVVQVSDLTLGLVGSLVDFGGGDSGSGTLLPSMPMDGDVVVVSDSKGDVVAVGASSSGGIVLAGRVEWISTDVKSNGSCCKVGRARDRTTATLERASVWLATCTPSRM